MRPMIVRSSRVRPAKSPPKRPGRRRAQELVQQVTVARFHVDEIKTDLSRQPGGGHVGVDQSLHFVVGEHQRGVVRIDVELGIQQRMVICQPRLEPRTVRPAEPARVSQLQADTQPVQCAQARPVGLPQFVQQRGQSGTIVGRSQCLIRIRPAVGHDRGGFSTPDQLRAAEPKVVPTPERVRRRRAIAIGVPSFHGMDAPTIAGLQGAHRQGLSQRRTVCGAEHRVIHRQIKPQLRQPGAQLLDRFQLRDFGIARVHRINRLLAEHQSEAPARDDILFSFPRAGASGRYRILRRTLFAGLGGAELAAGEYEFLFSGGRGERYRGGATIAAAAQRHDFTQTVHRMPHDHPLVKRLGR